MNWFFYFGVKFMLLMLVMLMLVVLVGMVLMMFEFMRKFFVWVVRVCSVILLGVLMLFRLKW